MLVRNDFSCHVGVDRTEIVERTGLGEHKFRLVVHIQNLRLESALGVDDGMGDVTFVRPKNVRPFLHCQGSRGEAEVIDVHRRSLSGRLHHTEHGIDDGKTVFALDIADASQAEPRPKLFCRDLHGTAT